METLDHYLAAINSRDAEAWRDTHHDGFFIVTPHGDVEVYERQDRIPPLFLSPEVEAVPWRQAGWDTREVVQVSDTKVHVVTRLVLFVEGGKRIQSHDAIHIITWLKRWAITAVSSFDPVVYDPRGRTAPASRPGDGASLEDIAMEVLDD